MTISDDSEEEACRARSDELLERLCKAKEPGDGGERRAKLDQLQARLNALKKRYSNSKDGPKNS